MKKTNHLIILILLASILQSCSWRHVFQIKNSTNFIWKVEYTIKDERGIFKKEIYIESKKEIQKLNFEGSVVSFEIKPQQTLSLGLARNSHYRFYSQYDAFDKEIPWKSFINIDKIKIFNQNNTFELDPKALSPFFSKNTRGVARLEIEKLIKSNLSKKP